MPPAPQAPPLVSPAAPPLTLRDYLKETAKKYRVDPGLALAILKQESGGVHRKPDGTVNTGAPTPYGQALGMFQVLPSTAATWQLDPADPFQNIEAGIRMIADGQKANPDPRAIFAYYHGGPDLRIHGPKTAAYADAAYADFLNYLHAQARGDADPERVFRLGTATSSSSTPAATGPLPLPTDRPPTVWERFTGQGSYIPPDIQASLDHARAVTQAQMTGAPPPPPRTTPLVAGRPLHDLGLDPTHEEDWPNIGGTVGGIGGGLLGTYAAGPQGGYYGSIGGAGIGGAIGQGARELFGTPTPGDTRSPAERVLRAGGEQGLYDLAGQAIAAPFRYAGKRIVQGGVSKTAEQFFEDARRFATNEASGSVDALRTAQRTAASRRTEAEIAQRAASAQDIRGARVASRAGVAVAQTAAERAAQQLADAQEAARLALRTTTRSGAADVRGARVAGRTGVERATTEAERRVAETRAAYEQRFGGPPTPEIPAGQSVIDVVKGPISDLRTELGQAVQSAAESGPDVDIATARKPGERSIKEEVQRIVDEELLPQEVALPRQPVPPPAPPAPGQAGFTAAPAAPAAPAVHPGHADEIAATLAAITDAQRQALVSHPAMPVIKRLLNAPDTVRFRDLAAWSSELRQAIAKGGDPFIKDKVEGLTQHLRNLVRDQLAHAGPDGLGHAPYEAATQRYGWLMDHLEGGHADDIAKAIQEQTPEVVAQMFDKTRPSLAKRFVETMTTVAGAAGEKAGAQGRAALGKVQRAWMDRELLGKGIEGLPDALADLDKHGEFRDAFLATPEAKTTVDNMRKVAAAWTQTLLANEEKLASAKTAKTTGIEAAQSRARTAVEGTQSQVEARVKAAKAAADRAASGVGTARETGAAGVQAARDKAAAALAPTKAADRKARLTAAEALQAARAKVRDARQPTPEELAFLRSSVSPEALRASRRGVIQIAKAIVVGSVGYKALGMFGSAAALLADRGISLATDADLLQYMFASPDRTQALIEHIIASAKPGWTIGQALRAGSRSHGTTSTKVASDVYATISGADKDQSTAPPPPPR
jgi:hypothetical protein